MHCSLLQNLDLREYAEEINVQQSNWKFWITRCFDKASILWTLNWMSMY